MNMKKPIFAILVAAVMLSPALHAANGTWTVDANGLWSTSANWSGGTIADGSGSTANFTYDITADRTVSLDTDRTLTSLVFGDSATGTAGSWILNNNGVAGNNLILAGTTPGITVNALGTGKTATISAIIEGSAGLVKSGSGTLTLTGANTRTGMLTINAGTVNLTGGASAQLGARTASVTLADVAGATLDFTGVSGGKIIGSLSGGGTNGGNIVNTAGLYFGDGASGNFTYGGIISGTGFMSYGGTSGTQTLSGMNTYTGSTTISKGTLSINSISNVNGGASSLGSVTSVTGGTITIGSTTTTGTLLYTGTGHSTDRVVNLGGSTGGATLDASGSGALVFTKAFTATGVGAKTLTLTGDNTADNRIGGAIVNSSSGATSLTKSGTGKWVLSGANTYTGGTTVSTGTLIVNNTSGSGTGSGSLLVSAGATLGGSGEIAGITTISGILAPGNSIGTLTVANDVTWNGSLLSDGTANWKFELGEANTADLLRITGGASEFLKGSGDVFCFDFLGSTDTGIFKLVDWESTALLDGGGVAGTSFAATDFSYTNLGGGNSGTFKFNGSQLEFQAIPEPSAGVLMVLAGSALLVLRRRRNS
jgi:autotransporter-associated beta strand protein